MMDFTNEYMHKAITNELIRTKRENTSRAVRMAFANDLIEQCINERGEKPNTKILERLATLILQDELRDQSAHKVRHNEYPILSARQERRRKTGIGTSKRSVMGEISAAALAEIGVDGRSYRSRTRTTNRRFREMFKI